MKQILFAATLVLVLLFSSVAMGGVLPDLAAETADELDAQLVERLGMIERPARDLTLIITTPADLNNLESSCPLARLFAEELATWFTSMGYKVQEARLSETLMFSPEQGEFMLTRNADIVSTQNLNAMVLLTGTYIVTSRSVRFSIRLVHAGSNETLAMASSTLPLTAEAIELLGEGGGFSAITPSVATRIPSNRPY